MRKELVADPFYVKQSSFGVHDFGIINDTQKYWKGKLLLKFKLGFTEVLILGKMIKPMCAHYLVDYSSEIAGGINETFGTYTR